MYMRKIAGTLENVFNLTPTIHIMPTIHIILADQASDQQAQQGTGISTITFPKPGPANLYVSVDSVAGVPSGEFVETWWLHRH
jgi:hypothetical protein